MDISQKSFRLISEIEPIKGQSHHHIETSQLICSADQLSGFYMMTTLAFNGWRPFAANIWNHSAYKPIIIKTIKFLKRHQYYTVSDWLNCFLQWLFSTKQLKRNLFKKTSGSCGIYFLRPKWLNFSMKSLWHQSITAMLTIILLVKCLKWFFIWI